MKPKSETPKFLEKERLMNGFFRVEKSSILYPSGHKQEHYTLLLPSLNSVSILALTEKNELLVNYEWRGAVNGWCLSLPGGFLEEGEDPLQGAARELLEETGFAGPEKKLLGTAYPMPGICNQQVSYVLVKPITKLGEPTLEGGELIETHLMSLDELHQEIHRGTAVDGILLAGLQLYSHANCN